MSAIAFFRCYSRWDETILPEPEERKSIIPAIELPQFCCDLTAHEWPVVHAIDPPDICGDPYIFKVARSQPGAPIPQCLKRLIKPVTQRRHEGIAAENEWRLLLWNCATVEAGFAFHCPAINQTIVHGRCSAPIFAQTCLAER